MPQMGRTAQRKFAQARVAVIGAGGVKSALLYYLAAVGIGEIRIFDFDNVELSNLNRQILFDIDDIGRNKAVAAREKLLRLNPEIDVVARAVKISSTNIRRELADFEIVVEGGDSLEGRRIVNQYILDEGIPMVHASAQHNYGYCTTVIPKEDTACFECIFPDLPASDGGGSVPVMGIATGISGTLGAGEVVKLITGVGRPLVNGFLAFSGFQSWFQFVPILKQHRCPACGNRSDKA